MAIQTKANIYNQTFSWIAFTSDHKTIAFHSSFYLVIIRPFDIYSKKELVELEDAEDSVIVNA